MITPTLHTICNQANAGQTLLAVTAADLKQFAEELADKIREQNTPQYFSRKELMGYLGCCERTLWQYEQDGLITVRKVGHRNKYLKSEIYDLVEQGRIKRK